MEKKREKKKKMVEDQMKCGISKESRDLKPLLSFFTYRMARVLPTSWSR